MHAFCCLNVVHTPCYGKHLIKLVYSPIGHIERFQFFTTMNSYKSFNFSFSSILLFVLPKVESTVSGQEPFHSFILLSNVYPFFIYSEIVLDAGRVMVIIFKNI